MRNTADDRYTDGEYLASNPTWGEEDSAWKGSRAFELWQKSGLPLPNTVAEIGCGAGGILAKLHDLFPHSVQYDGFDIAPAAIEMARRRNTPRLSYHVEDLVQSKRKFDLLLCMDVFEHVENPFGFLRSLRAISPLVMFNIPLEMHVAGVLINHQLWTRRHYGHLHFYTSAVAFETLKECGYSTVAHDYVSRLTDLPRGFGEHLFWLPRKALSLVSREVSARVLGGTSLMVLARTGES